MNRTLPSRVCLTTVVAIAVPVLAASAAPAHTAPKGSSATVAAGRLATSAKTSAASPLAGFKHYQVVASALFTDAAGSQTPGTAACPSGSKLVGGGAIISSGSLTESLNSTYPSSDGLTWRVYVDNASGADDTFRVYAYCVKKVSAYSVVIGTGVYNPADQQTSATVTCPSKTVPLGGGGFASSGSTAVNLNTTIPTATGWRADVNNGSTGDDTATAYVICGKKPSGYTQVVGTKTILDATSQEQALVTCPSGTEPLSGGGYSDSGLTVVDLDSTAASGADWVVFENNGSGASASETAYAVCATV